MIPRELEVAIDAAAREHARIQYPHTAWDDLPDMDRAAMYRFVTPLVMAALHAYAKAVADA